MRKLSGAQEQKGGECASLQAAGQQEGGQGPRPCFSAQEAARHRPGRLPPPPQQADPFPIILSIRTTCILIIIYNNCCKKFECHVYVVHVGLICVVVLTLYILGIT